MKGSHIIYGNKIAFSFLFFYFNYRFIKFIPINKHIVLTVYALNFAYSTSFNY